MVYFVHFIVLFLSWFWFSKFGSARDNITTTQVLRDPETLESNNGFFIFGFFSPINTTNRYVGIWYNKGGADKLEVVWVANREKPLNDTSGVFKISGGGNLQLLDGQNMSIWSSNITLNTEVETYVAQLQDKGNLVLLNARGKVVWQSFDYPADSMLPGMQLIVDLNTNTKRLLSSWNNASDPSNGRFTTGINNHRKLTELFIWDGDRPYWRSGPWDGHVFMGVRAMYYFAPVKGFRYENNEGTISLLFSSVTERVTEHYVLNHDGVVFQKDWNDDIGDWKILWKSIESETECDIYGKCGEFGSCNSHNLPICTCLKGFRPKNYKEWSAGNWSSGCVRRTPLQCGTKELEKDGFLRLRNMKAPDNAEWLLSHNEDHCRRKCLETCLCLSYAYYLGFGCMIWSGSLIDIQDFSPVGVDLFIRLAHSELGDTNKWEVITVVVVIMGTAALAIILFCLWRWRGQLYAATLAGKTRSKEAKWKYYFLNAGVNDDEFQDFPFFEFKDLMVATSIFSESNKLGRGGFGTVYKGILNDGQVIAVKRLERASAQGLQEFVNEVVVISKLQHRNLVRLLGCCVEREEKLLVYEYMPNKSLDAILFDPSNLEHLDWGKRFNIIKGISRGLLYLHRDSRLKIIHRDLKASNILLDGNLNPKISDFGMARIIRGNQDQGDTKRIVGTYGYMSPEYAMQGRFSEKSDVFSFGVLLLEIVSGRRNNSFNEEEEDLSLLAHAWKLWNEDDILSLIDLRISKTTFQFEIRRCIQVGLLCVQDYAEDRPSITMVVSMIESEVIDLPNPTRPGFTQRRVACFDEAKSNDNGRYSVNGVSSSSLSGR